MKLHDMMQFKSKIEKKRHHFDLPSLPDREWQYMLQRAKMESMKKNEISPLYAFMSSARLSIALSTAILLVLALSLFYGNPNKDNSHKTNTASSSKTNINVVNVANSSFI
ncbi:hypothetical protein OFR22_07825 [Brachyspira hyodysenteriae]|uniref:Uncharacterized protein n=1 Tax=Brachyspira hyodysenteriae ATCC 27164 TaxID=1266923 RepID=A0A3B6VSX0_BRAHO|nr:hypothetical protein [Brachyspira hyodysenteriae]ANN64171.1 hypothetical protein BHYOB78_09915 [Brachyspira hyodysenteriae ATCC 27164]AUJ49442.1 hypothetical protein BH718_00995 [Brachyspira hyodysenteriae]KLI14321.1 hypothetical protein SU44_10970 [Brachyspira hyodysenteriae]KLI15284.1 hypothetical protein SU46_10435 [Brachyspira hyodysenteriae]KLI17281.1 hypothetical protein SU45_05810 [Brachyspira hyodysenteriae]